MLDILVAMHEANAIMEAPVAHPDMYRGVSLLLSLFTATLAPTILLRSSYGAFLTQLMQRASEHHEHILRENDSPDLKVSAERLKRRVKLGNSILIYSQNFPIILNSCFAVLACGWIVYWWDNPKQPDVSQTLRYAFGLVALVNLGCFMVSLFSFFTMRMAARLLSDYFHILETKRATTMIEPRTEKF